MNTIEKLKERKESNGSVISKESDAIDFAEKSQSHLRAPGKT